MVSNDASAVQPSSERAIVSVQHLAPGELPLHRDAFGRLVLRTDTGDVLVVPVRSFPITAPDEGLALVGQDGREYGWVERLRDAGPVTRTLLEQELSSREFTPEIRRIISVSSYATPSHWQVETDRGVTTLSLKGEEDIRRLPGGMLMIADHGGVHFLLRDVKALDAASRRLLDHFL
ncbi:MAG: DUF1854 domain-containing protein [Alcaligenaceae bacterium]|nr:DUF1854 domain-containing protein [Alcaligenaceae bacterium]